MSLKAFFFNETPGTGTPAATPAVQAAPVTFPTATPATTFPTAAPVIAVPATPAVNEHLAKIIDVYDKRFASLNKPGYDFYEFFKAVLNAGIDNPQVYTMAMSMASAMDASVTKDILTEQADFYISEIDKIHTQFDTDGKSKLSGLSSMKISETESLTADIKMLNEQLKNIQEQLASRTQSLEQIDAKFMPEISEIGSKLIANDMAKDRLTVSLVKVKTNLSSL